MATQTTYVKAPNHEDTSKADFWENSILENLAEYAVSIPLMMIAIGALSGPIVGNNVRNIREMRYQQVRYEIGISEQNLELQGLKDMGTGGLVGGIVWGYLFLRDKKRSAKKYSV